MTRLADHPLVQLTLVRVREFTREPEAVFWSLLFPVLITVGLGIAFQSRPPDVLKVATTSATLASSLRLEPGLDVVQLEPVAAARQLAIGGVVLLAEQSADGLVTYRYDDTNPESRTARMLADRAIQRGAGRADPVATTDMLVQEVGSRYVDFLVPGLVGLGVMTNTLWGLSFSIVDSRRRKLTKRLMATPMSRAHYLLSYLVWRLLVLVVEVGVPVAFGAWAFGVPVRGSLSALVVISVVASLSFSAQALLLASRARTIEAASGLVNLMSVPMWILSGVFFSAQRFPDAVQPFIAALPLTALNDALRAHMLQGASLAEVAPQLGVLAAWLVICFALALRLFRWR
ncbi:MAG TPA: ABC transporter permease [Vicinamibacterales bacterium]|nr:ABC transporter permease [Acidobacteriota bacterium]HQX81177.1 ABC transporter permease [Vicinamibacterales bacterium]